MARVYMACGQYQKAQPLAEKALDIARKNNEPDSQLSSCMIDLAWVYKFQGKLTDAEKLCEKGTLLQQKTHGPDYPYLAYSLRT